jgi:hypothetical protein
VLLIDAIVLKIRDGQVANRRGMRAIFREQLTPAVRSVIGDATEAAVRAGLISTQMLGLALCRNILQLAPVAALAPATIVAQVGPTIQRYLTGPIRTDAAGQDEPARRTGGSALSVPAGEPRDARDVASPR